MSRTSRAMSTISHRDQEPPPHLEPQQYFPLMELPFELRLSIYQFLIPNIFREEMRVNTKALRDDGPCYPALLRANRQLYKEVSKQFYGQVYFRLWINPSGWHFNGNDGMPIKNALPSAIQMVGQLDLSIYLGMYSDNFNYKQLLSKYFRSTTTLRNLRLRLVISIEFFDLHQNRLELLKQGLEAELYPLKEARGLCQVILHTIDHDHPTTAYGHEESFEESMAGMLEMIRSYLDDLTTQMTSLEGV
ncbi:hypothetical protein PVAG01_11432 [Phlyctema vagabunda]|uniref:Uncharacterized protein n=1 Tax=Phlyctema vagabunda TaxID=108571 RepID=A0ABR4P2B1_9HELO